MGDELYEHETKQTLTREEAAARLHQLADDLARHNQVRIDHGDREVVVSVPDEVQLKFEVEAGSKSELEVSISW